MHEYSVLAMILKKLSTWQMRKNIALLLAFLASVVFAVANAQFLYFARAYWFFVITQIFVLCLLGFVIATIRISKISLQEWQRLLILMLCNLHLAILLQRMFLIPTFSMPVFWLFPFLAILINEYLKASKS